MPYGYPGYPYNFACPSPVYPAPYFGGGGFWLALAVILLILLIVFGGVFFQSDCC